MGTSSGEPGPAAVVLWVAPVVFWLVVAALGVWWPPGYYRLVAEDRVFEWIQVAGYGLAAGACLVVAVSVRRNHTAGAVAAALGCALFVVVVGEEVAWGQRLLGVSVPALEQVNEQGDVSLHNIGPGLTVSQVGMLGLALAGLLSRPAVTVLRRRGFAIASGLLPPPFLLPWFGLAAAFVVVRLLLFSSPPGRVAKFSEVVELTMAVAAAITTVRMVRTVAVGRPWPRPLVLRSRGSREGPAPGTSRRRTP
jgi:hypothetical protein